MTLLDLDRVSRRYGGLTALHELTLSVPSGARHAVIGANGAGKTTLFNLIAGTVHPSDGRILFGGRDVTRLGPAARARQGVSRTFQHPAVVDRLTAAENVALAVSGRASMSEALAAAGLSEVADVRVGTLPYGSRRRLEVALALATRPRLLLLDEPSAGLHPDEIADLTATIRALPPSIAVLLIDHHLDLVWDVADTVTVLHHGRHITTGATAAVRADPAVHAAYLTPQSTVERRAPRTAEPLLRVRGLRVGYHGAPVLHDLDLDVPAGAVTAVLGRNGAGKSTLLNAIAGLHPRHGSVELDGTPLPSRPDQAARAGVAIVPQGRRLFDLTVSEHLTLAGRRATGWTRDDVLTLLPPLAARLGHHAARLSGGEQQMLALARALLSGPRLLLLDEPTEGLAPTVVDHLATALSTVTAGGVTVLLAEQHLSFALRIADRVVALDRGRSVLDTTSLDDADVRRRVNETLGVATPHR